MGRGQRGPQRTRQERVPPCSPPQRHARNSSRYAGKSSIATRLLPRVAEACSFPTGYFLLALEGASRVARYFCVPFGQPYAAATEALAEIAAEARASVVGYSQMSARELAQNTGESLREAELSRDREFSERFFFAGEVAATARRFAEVAKQRGWDAIPGEPFGSCALETTRAKPSVT